MRVIAVLGAVVVATAGGCARGRSTLAGVYSLDQAAHGADVYAGMCVSCHAGMGNHVGPIFRARWAGTSLFQLYHFIRDNMPKDDPGSLAPEDCAAVVAYLLQLNGMPAGKTPLATDSLTLQAIRYDTLTTGH